MVPISLNTRCRLDARGTLFGRLRLDKTALRVSWWTLGGRPSMNVDLADVRSTEWWTGREDVNLAIHIRDGSTIAAIVPAAGIWKFEIDSRLRENQPPTEYTGDGQERVEVERIRVVPGRQSHVFVQGV